MKGKTIKVGSRDSLLAVRQAEIVMEAIRAYDASLQTELVTIKTRGDQILDRSLDKIGGKGLFIKELEVALQDGDIDLAVHSFKDMPVDETPGLPIVALSARETPFDALVLPMGVTEIDRTKPVGSSSQRRSIQFLRQQPGLQAAPIRGNVLTRLQKLDRGEFSAIILAQAGLVRLGLAHRISKVFTAEEMLPSASQGILAVQGRAGEDYGYLKDFHSAASEMVSKAERQFLKTLNGGCTSPVAAFAQIDGEQLSVSGFYVSDSGQTVTGKIVGPVSRAARLGEELANTLKGRVV